MTIDTAAFTIQVVDGNEFNEGWLAFVLGLPREPQIETRAFTEGWRTAEETTDCMSVRMVFAAQRDLTHPQYVVKRSVRRTLSASGTNTIDIR